MAKQTINLGTAPTGVGGDTPRSAFIKAQANFDELYTLATGSIIERGVNVNGEYVKYGDGTMECWSAMDYLGATIQGQSGALFFGSQFASQAYPVAFIALPAASQYFEGDGIACWGCPSNLSTHTAWASIIPFSDSSRTARTLRLHRYAIGRWK
jgi:hypothetical protein